MSIRRLLSFVVAGTLAIAMPTAARATSYNFMVLHTFGAIAGDGQHPLAGLVADGTGNLYGTTFTGGSLGHGTVFMLIKGASGYTEAVLHNFGTSPNASDGANPAGGLLIDTRGNLYGTTRYGGGAASDGVVFELSPGARGWTETVLHTFSGTDGAHPLAGLVADGSGNLYGTTSAGGTKTYGAAFMLQPGSLGWTEHLLWNFGSSSPRFGTDGVTPVAPLVLDKFGNVYGTTEYGGQIGRGVAFELARGLSFPWAETVLCNFGVALSQGLYPQAGLAFDTAGHLLGTTSQGGPNAFKPYGVVFKLNGNANRTETELHFFGGNPDGASPAAGLTVDSAGNIWGTTLGGGVGYGTVFELTANTWNETILHTFATSPNSSDGANPVSSLLLKNGNIFGTTQGGGNGNGVVFELTPTAPTSSPQPLPLLVRRK